MRHKRLIKQIHRSLFLAMQADAMECPGGIRELGAQTPSLASILEIIKVAQAARSKNK